MSTLFVYIPVDCQLDRAAETVIKSGGAERSYYDQSGSDIKQNGFDATKKTAGLLGSILIILASIMCRLISGCGGTYEVFYKK